MVPLLVLVMEAIEGALQGEKARPLKMAFVVEVTIVEAVDVEPASTILINLLFALSAVVAYTIGLEPEKSTATPRAPTVDVLPVPSV